MAVTETAALRSRAIAFATDALLLYATLAPLLWLLDQSGWVGPEGPLHRALKWSLPALALLACWWFLAATPGQMIGMMRVVDARTGERMSARQCLLRWGIFLLSALPLGLGFLWVAIDPQRRCLHDSLPGTTVRQAPRAPRHGRFGQGLIDHWRGELPLAISFWRNTVLVLLPLLMLAVGLSLEINFSGNWLRLGSAALLLVWPLFVLAAIWGAVGSWRAIAEHRRMDLSLRWVPPLQVALGLIGLLTLFSTAFDFIPRAGGYVRLLSGADPLGQATMTASRDGGRIQVDGPLGMGDGARFLALADGLPQLRAVEIASPGGRLHEAQRPAEFIRQHRLVTRVTGNCSGNCALVFMAGETRQLMPGAALGLHREATGIFNPLMKSVVAPELSAVYRRYGTPANFIAQLQDTPFDGRWQPTRNQLVDAELIDPPAQSLDIPLPPAGTPDASVVLTDALRGHPTWYWVDRQILPGLIDAAAARMAAALADPARKPEEVQAEGQGLLAALQPQVLAAASYEMRGDYLLLWREQLKAARQQGSTSCTGVLMGDPLAKRKLPPDLLGQENDWLIQAAMQTDAQADPPRPINANEIVVLSRELGANAPAILAGMYGSARKPGARLDCERSIAILDTVMALKLNVRRLAARALFQEQTLR